MFCRTGRLHVDIYRVRLDLAGGNERLENAISANVEPNATATAAFAAIGTLKSEVVGLVVIDQQAGPLIVLFRIKPDPGLDLKITGDRLDVPGGIRELAVKVFLGGEIDTKHALFNVVRRRVILFIRIDPLPAGRPFLGVSRKANVGRFFDPLRRGAESESAILPLHSCFQLGLNRKQ